MQSQHRASRRVLLATASGAAVAAVASATGRRDASAADGSFIKIGSNNTGASSTKLTSSTHGTAFWAESTANLDGVGIQGVGDQFGVGGYSERGVGVSGASDGGGSSAFGVRGTADEGTGVFGESTTGTGVRAETSTGTAFSARMSQPSGTAVSVDGKSVFRGATTFQKAVTGTTPTILQASASTGTAISAVASGLTGTALHASAALATALRVDGRASFSNTATFGDAVNGTDRILVRSVAAGDGVAVSAEAKEAGTTAVQAIGGPGVALDVQGRSAFTGPATFAALSAATLAGNGAAITALNASALSSGAVPEGRLPASVARLNAAASPFTGKLSAQSFAGAGTPVPAFESAGSLFIRKGSARGRVATPLATNATKILAVLQGNPGAGATLKFVQRIPGGFDVVLSKRSVRRVRVDYFLLRKG